MTDPIYQLAELEKSRERWRTAALASWLISALLALGFAGMGLQWHAETKRARAEAERATIAAEEARVRELQSEVNARRAAFEAEVALRALKPAPAAEAETPKD
jgi:hypothetical protein